MDFLMDSDERVRLQRKLTYPTAFLRRVRCHWERLPGTLTQAGYVLIITPPTEITQPLRLSSHLAPFNPTCILSNQCTVEPNPVLYT